MLLRITSIGMLLLSGIFGSASAKADTIVQMQNFNGTPAFVDTLTFNQFDGSLGTLNSITVEFELTSQNGQLLLDNDAQQAANGTVQYGSNGSLSSADVGLINAGFQPVVGTLLAVSAGAQNLAGDDGDVEVGGTANFSLAGPDAGTLAPANATDNGSGNIALAAFGDYIGLGTYDIDVNSGQIIDFGGIGGVQFQGDPISVTGFVKITYDFTANIPEPTTIGVLSIAFGFLGLRRNRK